jgi:Ca2+-binding EF-hand superfamily protein
MRRFPWLLMTIALLSATLVGAQGQPRLTRQQIMAFADTNGDGTIDRLEFLERMREAFFFVDANRDGVLTLDEYQRLEGADPRGFARADRNHDGKLSLEEFLKAVNEDFDAADTNNDGVLEEEEVKAWIAD